jgi:hypothetical protein
MPSSTPVVRELPTKVAETFYVVQDPALFNTSYSDALLVGSFVSNNMVGAFLPRRAILWHVNA